LWWITFIHKLNPIQVPRTPKCSFDQDLLLLSTPNPFSSTWYELSVECQDNFHFWVLHQCTPKHTYFKRIFPWRSIHHYQFTVKQVSYIISSIYNTHIHWQSHHHHSFIHHYILKFHIILRHSHNHQVYYTIT